LKKTRRIEITAFRRQVTVYSDDHPRADANNVSPSRNKSWPNIEANDRLSIDIGQDCVASLDAGRAGEWPLLAEALIESEGKRGLAVPRLGIVRTILYSRRRYLGVLLRRLKARINVIRRHSPRPVHKIDG